MASKDIRLTSYLANGLRPHLVYKATACIRCDECGYRFRRVIRACTFHKNGMSARLFRAFVGFLVACTSGGWHCRLAHKVHLTCTNCPRCQTPADDKRVECVSIISR